MAITPEQQKQIAAVLWGPFARVERRITGALLRLPEFSEAQLRKFLAAAVGELAPLRGHSVKWASTYIPSLHVAGVEAAQVGVSRAMVEAVLGNKAARQRADALLRASRALREETASQRLLDIVRGAEMTVERLVRAHREQAIASGAKGTTVPIRSVADAMDAAKDGRLLAWQSGTTGGATYGLRAAATLASHDEIRGALDDGFKTRCRQFGIDVVRISRHNNPCPACGPWEGVLVSIDGSTPGYPTLDDAISDGYKHPNCYHVEEPVEDAPDATDADRDRVLSEVADRRTAAEEQRAEWAKRAEADRERFRDEAMQARGLGVRG